MNKANRYSIPPSIYPEIAFSQRKESAIKYVSSDYRSSLHIQMSRLLQTKAIKKSGKSWNGNIQNQLDQISRNNKSMTDKSYRIIRERIISDGLSTESLKKWSLIRGKNGKF